MIGIGQPYGGVIMNMTGREQKGRAMLVRAEYRPLIHLCLSRDPRHTDTIYQEWNDPWSMNMQLLLDQWDSNIGAVREVGMSILDMSEAVREEQLNYLKDREVLITHLMLIRSSEDDLFWTGTKYQTPTSRKEYVNMGDRERRRIWEQIQSDWSDLTDSSDLVVAWRREDDLFRVSSCRQIPKTRREYIQMGKEGRRREWDYMDEMKKRVGSLCYEYI